MLIGTERSSYQNPKALGNSLLGRYSIQADAIYPDNMKMLKYGEQEGGICTPFWKIMKK